jgi:hypothetical protein
MSVKISCPKPRYSGNSGEHDLKQALELLFLVKAKLYKQTSPDFFAPTAEEFFSYCKLVSEEMYQKRTGGRRVHRSLSSERFCQTDYVPFYEHILQMDAKDLHSRLILCICIPLYALFLYYHTGIYMKQTIGVCDEEYSGFPTMVQHSMSWFCVHILPSLESYKGNVLSACLALLQSQQSQLQSSFDTVGSPKSFYKTAMQFSTIFDKVVVEPGVFENLLKKHAPTTTVG